MTEHAGLELGHGSLHPQQQAVVDQGWIVDGLPVRDQGSGDAAKLDQVLPLAAIASQARSFQAEDRSHRLRTDRSEEFVESAAVDQAHPRVSLIDVDDGDVLEPQLARPILERILQPLALQMVAHLVGRRLANVDDGFPLQMFIGQLGVHRLLPASRVERWRR